MASEKDRDIATPSHQRPPFADPLPGGMDPTAPGAPHEPGGDAMRQSRPVSPATRDTRRPEVKEPRPETQPDGQEG